MICFILVITIIGIPLALLLAPLTTFALVVLFLFGFAGVAMAGGQLLRTRFGWAGTRKSGSVWQDASMHS